MSGGKLVEIQKGDKFKRKEASLVHFKESETKEGNLVEKNNENKRKFDKQS